MKTRVWITWEDQRRNRSISRALEAKLIELKKIDSIKNPIIKYGTGICKTLIVLLKEKPDLVFGQNPSLILSLFLIIIKRFLGFKVIIDAHNAGLFPLEGRSRILLELSRIIQQYASLTIVTNVALKAHVERNGGKAFILPDPIPEFPKTKRFTLPNPFNLLFICSFAEDEPYEIVFKAAKKLDPSIHIYVTGN